jgi:eukaryotic-like serine/threonine-protein kinase
VWAAAGIAGVLVGALAGLLAGGGARPRAEKPLTKFRLSLPAAVEGEATFPTIAPDGRSVAYLMGGSLWIQALGELEPRRFTTEPNASKLFWSPDAKQIGYLAGTRIYRTTLGGAENQLVCDTRGQISTGGWGATWREDGTIVYSRGDEAGLLVVAAKGGDPHTLLEPDSTESDFHDPWALPGDRGILFASHANAGGVHELHVWSPKRGRKLVLELTGQSIATPCWSPTGHILFRRSPTTPGVWALPFSLDRLEATGEPFIVAPEGVSPTVSRNGTLAFAGSSAGGATEMYWTDRTGKALGTIGDPEADGSPVPALSPDGTKAIRSIMAGNNRDLWEFDTRRGTKSRLTFQTANEDLPSFSPAGDRIAYHAALGSTSVLELFRIVTRRADGTGTADTLATHGAAPLFTPDGTKVIYVAVEDNTAVWDLTEIGSVPGSPSRVLVQGNPRAYEGHVSPKGDLMAYMSNESGDWEVFLTRYPSCEGKWQVSSGGGQWPKWDGSGKRLYYLADDRLLEVQVTPGPSPALGTPVVLFTRPRTSLGGFSLTPSFQVTRDGQRFLMTRAAGGDRDAQGPTLVQNWAAEFEESKAQ